MPAAFAWGIGSLTTPFLGHEYPSNPSGRFGAPVVPSRDATGTRLQGQIGGPPPSDAFEPGVLLVGLNKARTWQQTEPFFVGLGVNRLDSVLQLNVHKVRVPEGEEDKYLRLIRQVPGVAYAEPNFYVRTFALPQSPRLAIGAPQLLLPPNGSTITDFKPVLVWTNPQGTKAIHLTMAPANNDGAGVNLILGAVSSFSIPPPPEWYGLLPDMTYTWRVRVSDAEDVSSEDDPRWGPWSTVRTFRTAPAAAASISAGFPTVGAAIASTTPQIQWSDSNPYNFYYELQLSPDPTFNTDPATATTFVIWVLLHGGATSPRNSYAVPPGFLAPGHTYHWRVRPRVQGDGKPAAWSLTWSFQTTGAASVAPTPTPTAAPVSAPIATATSTPIVQATPSGFPGAAPDDPRYALQWNLRKINALDAWRKTTGSASVTVAVIDSGVDLGHPDLVASLVGGYTCVTGAATPQDDNGHGTHVAGTVDAKGNNGLGVAGVAWNVRIMPVKVMNKDGSGTLDCILKGTAYAVDRGAKVINLSLGSSERSSAEQAAVNYALSKGVVVVAASGNCGDPRTYTANGCKTLSPPSYPAAFPGVLAVAATDPDDERATYSSYGAYVQVAAPGGTSTGREGILSSCWRGGECTYADGYTYEAGTSMASPHVAGLAALILSAKPDLSGEQVIDIIKRSVVDLGTPGKDDQFGYGRIDAAAALALALGVTPSTPTPAPVLPTTPTRTPSPGGALVPLTFGAITFGTALGPNEANCEVTGAGNAFPAGTSRVFYRIDQAGTGSYTRNWYFEGDLVLTRALSEDDPSVTCTWSGIYQSEGRPLPSGTYKLEMVVNGQAVRQASFVIAASTVATPTPTATPSASTAPLAFGSITFGTGVADQSRCLLSGAGTTLSNVGSKLYARYDYTGGGIFTSTWYLDGRKIVGPSLPYTLDGPSGCLWEDIYTTDGAALPAGTYRLDLAVFGTVVRSGTVVVTTAAGPTPTATPVKTPTAGGPTPTPTSMPTGTPTSVPSLSIGPITFGTGVVNTSSCSLSGVGTTLPAGTTAVYGRFDYSGSGYVSTAWYLNGVLVIPASSPSYLATSKSCELAYIYSIDGSALPAGLYRLDLLSGGVVVRSGTVSVASR